MAKNKAASPTGTDILSNKLFEHEMVSTTRVFGRAHNITVHFRGNQAMTDGTKVILPALGDRSLSENDMRIMRGYVDHEASHIRHTEMSAIGEAKEFDERLMSLLNGVEDVRLDNKTVQEYGGSRKNLTATAEAAAGYYLKALAKEPGMSSDKERVSAVAITWAGRLAGNIGGAQVQKALDTLPDEFKAKVNEWGAAAKACQNTAECLALAHRIFDELGLVRQPPGDKKNEGEGDDEGEGVSGGGGAVATNSKGSGNKMLDTDLGKVLAGNQAGAPLESYIIKMPNMGDGRGGVPTYDHILQNQLTSKIAVMTKTFERILASTMLRARDRNLEAGRLDSRRLTQAFLGRHNVFWMPADRTEIDTFVSVLIDLSGSMQGDNIDKARMAMIAIGEVLERIGIKWELHGYDSGSPGLSDYEDEISDWEKRTGVAPVGSLQDRWRVWKQATPLPSKYSVTLHAHKHMDMPLRKERGKIGEIPKHVDGGTPTGEALLFVGPRLLRRPEKKKAVIVITDGVPNDVDLARQAVTALEKRSVPVFCIGIDTKAVASMTPVGRFAVVKNVDSLTGSMLDELGKIIREDRRAA